jgi:quercetin dioxygenase-like cupin family protein
LSGRKSLVEKTSSSVPIRVENVSNVPVEDLTKNGAEKVRVQYLIDERHGSNCFYLRQYTVLKGGHTPLDRHEYEHQVYVLSGRGLIRQGEPSQACRGLHQGDVVFIPSNAVHQFTNESDEPFVFVCVKGNPKLYAAETEGSGQSIQSQGSKGNC